MSRPDVVILGGGIIGCALAEELARYGQRVIILERGRIGQEASTAAAGILSAQTDMTQPGPLFELCHLARRMYPRWVEQVQRRSGISVGYHVDGILYLAMLFGIVVAILNTRLRNSRLGRSWLALREDEDVAKAMGINLVAIKLFAFASGAGFAAAAGALYAARQVNIFPDNFTLLVSIDVLSLIIIGGIGSIEGVVLGSLALIGLPEILRSVNEYRIVAFGALLIIMMILRPEGLLPSLRRKRELYSSDGTAESASSSD